MQFHKIPDDPDITGLLHRRVSSNNLIQMGVSRVLYGYRVRSGFFDDSSWFELDWCAGGNWDDVERLYSLLYAILSNREENHQCFSGLPTVSRIKPFYNDFDFVSTVAPLAGEFDMIKLERV